VSRKSVPFEAITPFLSVKGRIGDHAVRLLVDSGTPGLLIRCGQAKLAREKVAQKSATLIRTSSGWDRASRFSATRVVLGAEDVADRQLWC